MIIELTQTHLSISRKSEMFALKTYLESARETQLEFIEIIDLFCFLIKTKNH